MSFDPIQMLDAEIALWEESGLTPRLWWRDDDTTELSVPLSKLSDLAAQFKVPVLLAVIPSLAKQELSAFVSSNPWLDAATHGFSHTNHGDQDTKKTELTENSLGRSVQDVAQELITSRKNMEDMFGLAASQILVPPWNRISTSALQTLPSIGFKLLSTFTDQKLSTDIHQINCHIDLMHWRPDRLAKTIREVTDELLICLQDRRISDYPKQPIGILSHHLVHDENAWEATEFLMSYFAKQPCIKTLTQAELLSLTH